MKKACSVAMAAGLAVSGVVMAEDDPFLWLEEVEGEKALEWAEGQNERSLDYLKSKPQFEPIHDRVLEILTSDDRIAYPSLMGGEVYNFWRDGTHVRGIWRKTSRESYRSDSPEWDVIIDLDQLAEEEGENWVWAGSSCRYPDYDRCLVGLSIGGADAAVRREFDLESRTFVEDGYVLPESKSQIAWRDRDSVFLGPAFNDEEMTDSGYPRTVRIWERGTPPEDAELVYEGERGDVSVSGMRIWDGDDYYDMIVRAPGFFTRHYYHYTDGEVSRINVPEDASIVGLINGQLLVDLKSDWTVGETTFRQGALVAGPMESFESESPELSVLYQPGERSSIAGVSTTESSVLVNVLDNVVSRLERFTHDGDQWHSESLSVPDMGSVSVVSTDDRSDRFFYNYTGFLTPSTLFEANAANNSHEEVRSEPSWFDAEGMVVEQYEAESADGERIPYFVVKPAGFEADGSNPTLLSAYGGFEISRTPFYSGVIGTSWLERDGVYVLANIRGGGEFGPRWHQAALQENRQRAFDDLIAVAEDLIERDITSPDHLGIQGGSNGGLLVGAVMVQRPDLLNAVVCQVPLLDMKRYHKLLAGASWMAEYGDPDDPEQWAYIKEYSPYQNVSADADYPKAFFTTSTRDDRVHPGHARKMVAKMLDQGHDVLYYENIEGGHGGAANLEQQAYISALMYSYLHDRLAE
ncbi:S9 family peptidase [Wenzhouxiangella sp. AB-CW3]|uniref:prolyl oligopeptidase family serine peptidase n=1 Tax=Wenzhouxiangella sp. AB-CW3 TaxID=2771012 RepID=UPI00168A5FE5|nr:prolyl oligopeptidase family serine peptidase [Wenzhouxiangella sp. AB-CW3]QOC23457.1 S9 family peptidase [Wenzhouxiangella sp. AB-CW3]